MSAFGLAFLVADAALLLLIAYWVCAGVHRWWRGDPAGSWGNSLRAAVPAPSSALAAKSEPTAVECETGEKP